MVGRGWLRLGAPEYLWPEPIAYPSSLHKTECTLSPDEPGQGILLETRLGRSLEVLEAKFETLAKGLGQLSLEGQPGEPAGSGGYPSHLGAISYLSRSIKKKHAGFLAWMQKEDQDSIPGAQPGRGCLTILGEIRVIADTGVSERQKHKLGDGVSRRRSGI